MKAPTPTDSQARRPAAFTLETEETARPSSAQKRAPRSFDTEASPAFHEATHRIRQLIFGRKHVSAGRAAA